MIPNVSQINSKPLIFPNSGKGLVCDTFSGKVIFHNCTKHFPNEFRIFYKLWKKPILSSAVDNIKSEISFYYPIDNRNGNKKVGLFHAYFV